MSFGGDLRTLARGWRWGHRRLTPRSVPLPARDPEVFPTDWARTPVARAARAVILKAGFAPLLRFEVSRSVEGLDVFEDLDQPVLFVANHQSHLDAPLIMTSLPTAWRERTAVGAAADYFFDVWWRAAGTALAFNAFPVEREGSRKSPGVGRRLLADGWNLLIFPQGTRSRDGWITEFKIGAAVLACEAGRPVVPVALRGTYQAMPRGRGWPKEGRPPVRVRFGRPQFSQPDEDPAAFSERVRSELESTLREDRVGWWEARRKDDDLSGERGPDAADWRRRWESSRPLQEKPRAWR